MAFTGWPTEAVSFFEGLEEDNSKTYWLAHRPAYDQAVKAPMEALLADLAAEFGQGNVFRPYRDVRFSADKTPYKVNCAAHMPGGYLSFSADGLFVGTGLYQPDPGQLQRFRAAVADDRSGPELESLVAALRDTGYDVHAREVLKTAPRGYAKDHPRIGLLTYKGILMSTSWPVEPWLATAEAGDRVATALRAARPLTAWLDRNVH